jgi:hypothetical protein
MNRKLLVLIFLAFAARSLERSAKGQETLNGHRVVLDAERKLVSWVEPQSAAYDRVMRLAWDFLIHKAPVEPNGLKAYLAYCCLNPETLQAIDWPHNPAGLYGMFADSATAYYAYSGDREVVKLVESMLDTQLQHGTTPRDWDWAEVPFASSDAGATEYRGADEHHYCQLAHIAKLPCGTGDGRGVIEPDKVGELGIGYLKFYELTGEARYRDAAIACANALARHARAGEEDHSPWPFRVYAKDNKILEEYSSDVIGPIRLFDELMRLKFGDREAYRSTRALAWRWLVTYPMKNHGWDGYFEDVRIFEKPTNLNQYSAMETARYLLLHPESDPAWREHVEGLIHYVEKTFVVDVPKEPAVVWGANAVSEQLGDMNKMGSHTSRYASINALWYEKTGDEAAKEKAYRSFNWATYMCRDDGRVLVGPVDQTIWFSDGYGDYIRHFMAGLGAVPEWAPPGENHLLRSTSVVQEVAYVPKRVAYRTFDSDSDEVLRLNFTPRRILVGGRSLSEGNDRNAPGWTFEPATRILRIHHRASNQIEISGH